MTSTARAHSTGAPWTFLTVAGIGSIAIGLLGLRGAAAAAVIVFIVEPSV